jgi:hypothetical protein
VDFFQLHHAITCLQAFLCVIYFFLGVESNPKTLDHFTGFIHLLIGRLNSQPLMWRE